MLRENERCLNYLIQEILRIFYNNIIKVNLKSDYSRFKRLSRLFTLLTIVRFIFYKKLNRSIKILNNINMFSE